MTMLRKRRTFLAIALALVLVGGCVVAVRSLTAAPMTNVVAYFDNSNGIFEGDDVMILGVPVGRIEKIEPQPKRAKITLSVDDQYKVPADANAVVITPTLVTARAIQLTPAYSSGPTLHDGDVIPQDRTAVPVEFDDLREQLQKLTEALQPTHPGGVSTLGAFVNTAADNLHGQGANIRETLIQTAQAISALGDHSDDIFSTVKSLSTLVKALQSSTDLMRQLNQNLASVTTLVANDPAEVANAVKDLNAVVDDARSFIADNREAVGTTSDRLASITKALVDSLGDIKQGLHVAPNAIQNFVNIYEPANGAFTGALALNNFADPITFLCGVIQAASRLNAEQSAKLCVQYLAPIVKNRQYNFLPLGADPFVGAQARPNEVTFSEDRLRPLSEPGRIRDFDEGPLPSAAPPPESPLPDPPLPAEAASTDPAAGLPGMMVPPGAGS
jgi:phospholipid/cholesterol/gamma-HCH transport system substrate-binding protein